MKYFAVLLLLPTAVSAGTVFDGYEEYYATLPGQLFRGQGIRLQPYSMLGDEAIRYGWEGFSAGRRHKVETREGVLKIDGRVLKLKSVNVFPDEVASNDDLSDGATVYFAPGWICIENTPPSASGTAVRHQAVYLFKQTKTKPQVWKLPSLFAACASVRLQAGQVRFDKVEYRYQGYGYPVGVLFKGYVIQDGKFVASNRGVSATFVEPDNVYKFSVDDQ